MLALRFNIVLICWLFVCAAQQPPEDSKPSLTVKSHAAPATTFTSFPGYSSDRCYSVHNRDVAASCAEWKAADAAKSSADATWWTVYIAGVGAALAATTMIAAIAAALFAKRAAFETQRSADAAHAANRPWLDMDLILHGIGVNYDCKGYSLQLEIIPINAGASPAIDVRQCAECLFYDHIPEDLESDTFAFTARDRALQTCADAAAVKLDGNCHAGLTVFPDRQNPLYTEVFVPWNLEDGFPSGIAWIIVGLGYSYPGGSGKTIKVFIVKSFGFLDKNDFESVGRQRFATAKIDPVLKVWPRHGLVK